ncbi:50S ribosomal protein L10 [Patescibacteria group bacterium]
MTLTKEQKKDIVKRMEDQMKDAKSVIFADFKGLTVKNLSGLRNDLREKGVSFTVAKKTLIRLAAKNAGYQEEISDEALEGSVGVAFSMEDEIVAARMLHNFAKNNNLKLRGALFEGRILSVAETKELALIPGTEELLTKFVYLLKSPIQGFHGALNNTISGFVRVLNSIKEKQEQAS